MGTIKDVAVIESPKVLVVGESRAYTIDFSDSGTPADAGAVVAYDATGTDVSGAVLSGVNQLNGDVVTLKLFTPASEQTYRLVCTVSIGGQNVVGVVDVIAWDKVHAPTTTGASSYGDVDNVAALTPRFAGRDGKFSDTTRPTRAMVIKWIDQVSALLNVMLATAGFTVPITQTDAVSLLGFFVEQEVVTMVNGVNGSGRFAPTTKRPVGSIQKIIMQDIQDFIDANAYGIAALGESRSNPVTEGLGFREYNESGEVIVPLFQREAFGNEIIDWE